MSVQENLVKARTYLVSAYSEERNNSPSSELTERIAKFVEELTTIIEIPVSLNAEQKQAIIEEETRAILGSGNHDNLVRAIKHYRSKTGLGLMESKFAVERMQSKDSR